MWTGSRRHGTKILTLQPYHARRIASASGQPANARLSSFRRCRDSARKAAAIGEGRLTRDDISKPKLLYYISACTPPLNTHYHPSATLDFTPISFSPFPLSRCVVILYLLRRSLQFCLHWSDCASPRDLPPISVSSLNHDRTKPVHID